MLMQWLTNTLRIVLIRSMKLKISDALLKHCEIVYSPVVIKLCQFAPWLQIYIETTKYRIVNICSSRNRKKNNALSTIDMRCTRI